MLVSLNYKANVSVTKPRAFRKLVVHTIVCAKTPNNHSKTLKNTILELLQGNYSSAPPFANTGYFYHFLVAVNLASVQFHRLRNITLVYA